jgi:hypothetical protein
VSDAWCLRSRLSTQFSRATMSSTRCIESTTSLELRIPKYWTVSEGTLHTWISTFPRKFLSTLRYTKKQKARHWSRTVAAACPQRKHRTHQTHAHLWPRWTDHSQISTQAPLFQRPQRSRAAETFGNQLAINQTP